MFSTENIALMRYGLAARVLAADKRDRTALANQVNDYLTESSWPGWYEGEREKHLQLLKSALARPAPAPQTPAPAAPPRVAAAIAAPAAEDLTGLSPEDCEEYRAIDAARSEHHADKAYRLVIELADRYQDNLSVPYPNYAVQGVMLLSADTFGPAIPTQWDSAKRLGADIKTVVMTGGGNDVIQNPGLQSDCQMDGDQCKMFRMQLMAALDKLWTQMATDGVKDVIYIRYSAKAGMQGMMTQDASNSVVPVCMPGKIRCHALDTTDLVKDELALDNIHPLASANDRMAKAVVEMMEKEGMRR